MNAEFASNVNWVVHMDWLVRDFHGYQTKRGSSYNVYLVKGAGKTALINTLKGPIPNASSGSRRSLLAGGGTDSGRRGTD